MCLRSRSFASLLLVASIPLGCASSAEKPPPHDSGVPDAPKADAPPSDAPATDSHEAAMPPSGPPTASNIKNVVIIVQENHSFDNYYGRYCTAATGSNPKCNAGPACCEAAPAKDPGSGDAPTDQTDTLNGTWDPNHLQACELTEINGGKMDGYVTSSMCGSKDNFAYADPTTVKTYWDLAKGGALADRYFQSVVGASSSNDMYLSSATFVFLDDNYEAPAIGVTCQFAKTKTFTGTTIGDLLVSAKVPWGWFGEGYDAMVSAQKAGKCPSDPKCPAGGSITIYPCTYDPGDDPFLYYANFTDNPKYIFDYAKLATDLSSLTLPAVTYVKGVGYHTEHPGLGTTITGGEAFVSQVLAAIQGSAYANQTLVLVTWDESGGFFDHVAPPPDSTVDHEPYGPRTPFLALGPFAKTNYVSHVPMEHSSIVKFIEYNWLGKKTGQLKQRDAAVNNIGDLLDPAKTGATIPSD